MLLEGFDGSKWTKCAQMGANKMVLHCKWPTVFLIKRIFDPY